MTNTITERREQLSNELNTIQSELAQAKLAVDLFTKKEVELQTRLNELDALDQPESTVVDPVAV
jgi:chromosome segregation ATPase